MGSSIDKRHRNEATMPLYQLTCQFASLRPPSPEVQQLFAALRGNQADTNRLWGTISGAVPFAECFAPENVGRIVGTAAMVA